MERKGMNAAERMLNVFSQEAAKKAYYKRVGKAVMNYGRHGASNNRNWGIGWLTGLGDAGRDIDLNVSKLRERARDLDAGGGVSRSATRTLRTNVIGSGIKPKPKLDYGFLGMSEEAAAAWQEHALREFMLWAESSMCDMRRTKNFFALSQLAFLSMLLSGDVLVLLPAIKRGNEPYDLKIRLIEADRLCTPSAYGRDNIEDLPGGGKIINGVELSREGEVVAYHISQQHPYAQGAEVETVRIEAWDKTTGLPNVLHIVEFERPEQSRGVPYMSPEIERVKTLDRYEKSELAANLVASMLTVFLEQDVATGGFPMEDSVAQEEKATNDEGKLELAPGAIYKLEPGVKPAVVNPTRANTAYADYVDSLYTDIGASLEIPKEVLLKKFASNYTASRGALLEFWKVVIMMRRNFIANFCQPIYELWLAEAVAKGRVEAPGFFEDYAIRKAYSKCDWIGSSMGVIDPLKEVKASIEKINNSLSTVEREAAELNGSSWNENMGQRKKEMLLYAEIGKELGLGDEGLQDEL